MTSKISISRPKENIEDGKLSQAEQSKVTSSRISLVSKIKIVIMEYIWRSHSITFLLLLASELVSALALTHTVYQQLLRHSSSSSFSQHPADSPSTCVHARPLPCPRCLDRTGSLRSALERKQTTRFMGITHETSSITRRIMRSARSLSSRLSARIFGMIA